MAARLSPADPNFEAMRLAHHVTNAQRFTAQEEQLRVKGVPLQYWTYIIANGNDSVQPPQGVVCYDRECAERLATVRPDVQVLWDTPTFNVYVVDGRDVELVRGLAWYHDDPNFVNHCTRMQ